MSGAKLQAEPRGEGPGSMKLECSWCHRDLGSREPIDNDATTHGICSPCLQTRIYPLIRQARLLQVKQAAARPSREDVLDL